MSVLKTRAISALFFVIIMLSGLMINAWTQALVLAGAATGCLYEFNKHLLREIEPAQRRWRMYFNLLTGLLAICCSIYYSLLAPAELSAMQILACVLLLSLLTIAGLGLELADLQSKPFLPVSVALASCFYIGLPFAAAIYISNQGEHFNYRWVLLLFALIWANDTLAYLSGSAFGKRPFAPRISPKKTWEGTLGGAIFCVFAGGLLYHWLRDFSLGFYLGLGALVAVSATLGDLVESQFKRSLGIKDSGHIMPGHGGFLDRFDSFLFVVPVTTLYYYLFA